MDTVQIYSILKKAIGQQGCLGVFPSDKIPTKVKGPCSMVVNTDPSTNPGSHWVAIFITQDCIAEYFDSYGQPPDVAEISSFLNKYNVGHYNRKHIQGPFSSVCGHYCIYFVIQRWQNVHMADIVKKFSDDHDENDELITQWINDNYDVDTDTYDVDFLFKQICHALKNKPL